MKISNKTYFALFWVFDIIYRKNAPYGRMFNNRASMMAFGYPQLFWGMLCTTIQTCQVHYEGPGAPKMATQNISREVQNAAKIIIFAFFGMSLTYFIQKTFSTCV